MSIPIFRSDLLVTFDDASNKGDQGIALRAWVDPPGQSRVPHDDTPIGWRKLITSMMRNRHSSPFEGGWLSVYCEAPAVVWWEWTRHRFMSLGTEDHGFNLESGRYKVLDGEFYVPSPERPCYEPDGFKPMRPKLMTVETATAEIIGNLPYHLLPDTIQLSSRQSWEWYQLLTRGKIGRELARLVLPFNIYYAGYVSANLLTWLHFLSLRTHNPAAETPSFPQWEIEQVALQCENMIRDRWPITHAAFNECGRRAP